MEFALSNFDFALSNFDIVNKGAVAAVQIPDDNVISSSNLGMMTGKTFVIIFNDKTIMLFTTNRV